MTNLVSAYQRRDVNEAEKILRGRYHVEIVLLEGVVGFIDSLYPFREQSHNHG